MEPSFWHKRWERTEIGFHQRKINTHLQHFWGMLNRQSGQPIFVPLCGKTLDLLWLASQGHPVIGVEISALAVEAFFKENHLKPHRWKEDAFEIWEVDEIRILLGDLFSLEPHHLADVTGVYDRAALIALPPPMRQRYVDKLTTVLPVGIETLLVTLEYDQSRLTGPPFSVCDAEVQTLFQATHTIERLHTRNALSEESRWRERGLTWLLEKSYRLSHCSTSQKSNG
ncbi:MAG: thiopurine S-methyltransferase [Candidatus Contendobacter odensis]|uniref:Thiopurine S-methyltransferase n=1 Tax=Candidatus Contendibacter odensensis TaxID=1400860 RepID=A0A2G6PF97_9GAMM|nr:MAG: thiopurine S-methyltransferase [Candidatus Contendobacter odensis]